MYKMRKFSSSAASRMQNHYEVLGINVSASPNDIKQRFFELSKKFHPDRNKDADPERYQQITAAYTVLSDDSERKKFDSQLGTAVRRPQGYHSGRSWEQSSNYAHTMQQRRPGASSYSYNAAHAHKSRKSPTLDPLKPQHKGSVPHFDFERHAESHARYERYRRYANRKRAPEEHAKHEEPEDPHANGIAFAIRAAGALSAGVGVLYLILR